MRYPAGERLRSIAPRGRKRTLTSGLINQGEHRAHRAHSFAKGNNTGIKEARGELIAILNNDIEVSSRWLEELVSAMNSDEKVGMCASKMLFMNNPGLINSTGICLSRSGTCWDRGIFDIQGKTCRMECLYVPEAIVYHVHGGTGGFETDYTIYYGNRNVLWIPITDFPKLLFFSSLPWIIGRNIGVIPYYILKGHGRAVIKAKADAIKG